MSLLQHALPAIVAVENPLFHSIGELFQPIFKLFATILAFIYAVIPNYAAAIAVLTILIMGALTPLTVKSTKSMLAMQRLQPEMKKLQQKYKGPENREILNQELMKLYKEAGVNPASGCVPMFLQMPFLIILYDIIKGLTYTVTVHGKTVSQPRYIPKSSKMYYDLTHAVPPGAMHALGMNLALKPTSYHPSVWAAIPYYALVLFACALQFVQMYQMNRRNPQATQANPQMRNMQYFMPIIFAIIYINIQSAVVIYMIVSTLIRIITQDILFRTGVTAPQGERTITGEAKPAPAGGSGAAEGGLGARLREALSGGASASLVEKTGDGKGGGTGNGSGKTGTGSPGSKAATNGVGTGAEGEAGEGAEGASTGGNGRSEKESGAPKRPTGGGSAARPAPGSGRQPQPQNRAKTKKARKAR